MALMMRVAFETQRVDHHSEWSNVHNRLDVWLTTHSVQGVSDRDLAMARHANAIAGNRAGLRAKRWSSIQSFKVRTDCVRLFVTVPIAY
jgi:hypothetical protein